MTDRPGLDDNDELKALFGIWRDGQADIDARIAENRRRILGAINQIGLDDNAPNALRRLRIEARRLDELQAVSSAIIDDLVDGTDRFINLGGMDSIYAAGAARIGLPFSFTAPHRAAVQVLANDTFGAVLEATGFVDADSKAWVRRVSKQLTGFKLTGGTPVKAQARKFEREIAREFRSRGIGAVTYRNGARHGFGEYAEMLMRTQTAKAYNAGTMNQGRLAGIRFYEILDGANCGLVSHHDPELANGKIVPYEVAVAFPIAHPNCRRALNPRADVTRADVDAGDVRSVQSEASRIDQAAFERALADQRTRRADARASRRPTRPQRGQPSASRPGRPSRASQATQRAQQTRQRLERRARIEEARAAAVAEQAERLAAERGRALGTGRVDPDVLRRWGVNEDQFLQARATTKQIRADIRAHAAKEADDVGGWLFDNDLAEISRPDRLARRTDLVSGAQRSVRTQSGYDFLEQLDDAELARVRKRMVDNDLYRPDALADQVRRKTNLDLTDDEAMDWLTERWLHEDGLRSLASGRIPKYADPDALLPDGLEGYRVSELFGVDADDAVGHVAQVQAEQAREFAARALRDPDLGPAPWTMDAGDYVRELEEIEGFLSSAADANAAGGSVDVEQVRRRLLELAPPDIDDGTMAPLELLEQIRITAILAGRPVPV